MATKYLDINGAKYLIDETKERLFLKADKATTYTKEEVDEAIKEQVGAAYKPAGSILFADLPAPSKLVAGNVYNIKDDFTTTAEFLEGAGKSYAAGTDVAIITITAEGEDPVYKYNVMAAFIDSADFTKAYIVGLNPFAEDWLSETAGGTAFTPSTDRLYVIATEGEYLNKIVRWNSSDSKYVLVGGETMEALTEEEIAEMWLPPAPTGVSAVNADGNTTVTWTVPEGDEVDHINVHIVKVEDDTVVLEYNSTTSPLVIADTEFTEAGAYKAKVISVDAYGDINPVLSAEFTVTI